MAISIQYRAEANLLARFVNHAQLGLTKNIQPHRETLPEMIGNTILWTVEDLPRIISEKLKDARIVTVAMTALSLLANSFLFYPVRTFVKMRAFYRWIPLPPFWAVRFTSYLSTCALIMGYGLRAYGRFSNHELMNQFYHNKKA